MFICGGAFNGLEDQIQKEFQYIIGFKSKETTEVEQNKGSLFKKEKSQDLIKYGIIPEFIGRFPVIAALEELVNKS
ncbi:MAG: hypothetical protein CM15mP12_7030 [Gammaproteobacteria bacterium]|nr:MAG: hypothetical protein CM15mP12_7030 [Gammaproteobacteria bacterium]